MHHLLVRCLGPLLVLALSQALPAADPALVLHLYCLDLQPQVLERFGEDRATGALPAHVTSGAAFRLLDADAVTVLGAITITMDQADGTPVAVDHTHPATYLETDASGTVVQRESPWSEGMVARISAHRDSEGRIRVDGQVTLHAIASRQALSGAQRLPLGKPLTQTTQSVVPGAVLRSGEACVIPFPGAGGGTAQRVLVVVAD
jgi:hypothetical protein